MQGRLFSVEGSNISQLRTVLQQTAGVVATTQIGLSLRVILEAQVDNGSLLLKKMLAGLGADIHPVAPSIEDVFVMTTQNGGNEHG